MRQAIKSVAYVEGEDLDNPPKHIKGTKIEFVVLDNNITKEEFKKSDLWKVLSTKMTKNCIIIARK